MQKGLTKLIFEFCPVILHFHFFLLIFSQYLVLRIFHLIYPHYFILKLNIQCLPGFLSLDYKGASLPSPR